MYFFSAGLTFLGQSTEVSERRPGPLLLALGEQPAGGFRHGEDEQGGRQLVTAADGEDQLDVVPYEVPEDVHQQDAACQSQRGAQDQATSYPG